MSVRPRSCALLLGGVSICLFVGLWLATVTFNDLPPFEAAETARTHVELQGYEVGGSLGRYTCDPDFFGGSEVEIEFRMLPAKHRIVAVRMRRTSALSGWEILGTEVRDP